MNRILVSMVFIISLMGCVAALDGNSKVEMQPGEAAFEQLYNHGIGQPWVGGNPPGFQGEDQGISTGTSSDIFSKYSEFYSMSKGNGHKTHIEAPTKSNINEAPTAVYFSNQMQSVPYSQYQTYSTYTGGNSLWIQGSTSWTQYATIPQGAGLSLLATTSSGGNGYLYEITPDGQLTKNYYNFFPGFNQINFYADTVGQHVLLFIIDGQVSNSVVIDVVSYAPSYQNPYPHGTYLTPVSTPISTTGDSQATIVSQGMRGYQVFLDGNYIGTEGTGGDPLDGKFAFRVVGNQNHEVRVYDGQFNYPKTMFFERGGTKIINVEPGTAV